MTTQTSKSATRRIDLSEASHVALPREQRLRETAQGKGSALENPVLGHPDVEQLLQSVHDGVLLAGEDGWIFAHNARAAQLLGASGNGLRGTHVCSHVAGADESALASVREALESERFVVVSAMCQRPDTSRFPAEIVVARLALVGGRCLGFFVRDVSRHHAAEQQLRSVYNAIQNAGQGIAIADDDGIIVFANPACERLWGFEGTVPFKGLHVRELIGDPEQADIMLFDAVRGGWQGECQVKRGDGKLVVLQVSATVNLDGEGERVGTVLSFVDVTARRRVEEELRDYREQLEARVRARTTALERTALRLQEEIRQRERAQRAAEQTEHYLEAVIGASQDGIVVVDAAGSVEFCNQAAAELFSTSVEGLPGRNLRELLPEAACIPAGDDGAASGPNEVGLVHSDGSWRYLLLSRRGMEVDGIRRWCIVMNDITDRRVAEDGLREAIQRLERINHEKSEFVSNASHELRTPLSSLALAADNLLSGVVGPVSDATRRYLGMIREDCERLTRTVNDILDISRIEAGRLVLKRRTIPLSRFVNRCVDTFRVECDRRRLRLSVEAMAGGFADCDARRLERAISNVVHNAIKYTPEGGTIEVFVVAVPSSPWLEIQVVDSGIGIPAEHIGRVTERYYRAHEHAPGTGLGLALCKDIVEMHGGCILVQSPGPGRTRGTQVTLRLPTATPPAVLVMSESETNRRLLLRQVGSDGYRAVGVPARTRIESVDLRGVVAGVVDLTDAESAGLEWLGLLRGCEETSRLPNVALIDEHVDETTRAVVEQLGLPVLTRPWRGAELMEALETAILSGDAR